MERIKRNKDQIILALLTFFLSFFVYMSTLAPTVSFWDCGEFIATSVTLGVPHPPGSPLFLLIGRFFSMLPVSGDLAYRINIISPLVSALSVMFLSLIIVRLTRFAGKPTTLIQKIGIYGGAFIGAMTFAFTDSHWFNAVEAEVYSFSTLLTSIVVWAILVWEERAQRPGHERYILIIAYIMGLALGIHLLNLLAVFFIALIVYYRYYKVSSNWWLVADMIISVAAIGVIFFIINSIVKNSDKHFTGIVITTLVIYCGGYFAIYKTSTSQRIQEHIRNMIVGVSASAIFLIINNGVIRGIPKAADKWGLWSIPVIILIIIFASVWAIKEKKNIIAIGLLSLILILVGYSTYTTIFVRSNQNPIIDENDPETTKAAISYLEREQYGRRSFTDLFDRKVWKPEAAYKYKGKSGWYYFYNYQIKKMYIRYFGWQFIGRGPSTDKTVLPFWANKNEDGVDLFQFFLPFPFIIGLFGAWVHFKKDENKALAVLALFLFTGFMILLYLNQDDPQPRERDYSYAGSFFTFAIWIGIGATALIRWVTELKNKDLHKPLTYGVSLLLLIVLPLNVMVANYHEHSRDGNFVASDYAYNILQTCEKDAIIFTNGDNDTFPLWYLQEVEKVRNDVKVVNLSLLNTHWYIKQLKDNEPKIKVGMSDKSIETLRVQPHKTQDIEIPAPQGNGLPPLKWKLKPTIGQGNYKGLRVQDLMILQLIAANQWKRPIYFAVTVSPSNKIGLDKYLQMEGLGFRLKPEKIESPINAEKLEHNINNVYRYRNLDNPDVFYNRNVKKLVGNYRSGFLQLAYEYNRQKKFDKVLEVLESMEAKLPEKVLPIRNDDLYLHVGMLYEEAKDGQNITARDPNIETGEPIGEVIDDKPASLEERVNILMGRPKATAKDKLKYASLYFYRLNDIEKAITILEELQMDQPNNPEVLSFLVQAYGKAKNFPAAVELLDGWLDQHPNDKQAAQMRDKYFKKIGSAPAETVLDSVN